MSTLEIDSDFIAKLDEIIAKAIQNGGLIAVGSNQCGKTNAMMWILRRIIQQPKHTTGEFKTLTLDDCLNWIFKFDKLPYITYSNKILMPTELQDLIVDLHDTYDPLDTKNIIADIIYQDFIHKQEIKQSLNGEVPFINFYMIEEIQNIFGRYALGQKSGRFIYKTVCECTNFGMCIMGLTQRLADVDTRIIERRRYYLLGRANGDNDVKKLKQMFGEQIGEKVKTLAVGSMVFFDKAEDHAYKLDFPKFEQNGNPYPYVATRNKLGSVKQLW